MEMKSSQETSADSIELLFTFAGYYPPVGSSLRSKGQTHDACILMVLKKLGTLP